MSESKHTPGPWTVDGPPWNQIVWSSAENRVCFLAHTNGLDDERDLATGRLIAAAPDLYEALKEIEAAGYGGYLTPELCANIVVAALAKAEARS